jgi:hypothetical protein
MHLVAPLPAGRTSRRTSRRPPPPLDEFTLDTLRIDEVRNALRGNRISFPTPVPTFERHDRPDLQWKLAELYFVLGWSCENIAARYGLIHQRVRQILNTWKRRAVEMGYIQYIPPAETLELRLDARKGHVLGGVLVEDSLQSVIRTGAVILSSVPQHPLNPGL